MAILEAERVLDHAEPQPAPRLPGGTVDTCVRWLLAACSLGAAAIHFAYAPTHLAEYWLYGAFFVALAWAQLAWAVGIVLRPWRWLLLAGYAANTIVIVVWVLSRTIGVWIGPDAHQSEAATFPDILATVLEALVVLGALVLLARPGLRSRRVKMRWLPPFAVAGAALIIGATAAYAMAPRFTAGHDHAHAAAALTGNTPCEKAGPPASTGQLLDGKGHFHRGPSVQQPVDEATRHQLQAQQILARAVVAKYPTAAEAERGGYRKSTVYVPCIGAHYTNIPLAAAFDPAAPSELLYDGSTPDAEIVGLSYLVYHPGGAPQGFAGPNDAWHQHTFNGGLCINREGLVIGAEATTPAQCAARGGSKIPLTDIWMLHDWVVPGFDCSWGVFASECPELGGRTGGTAWDAPDPSGRPIPQG